MFFVEWRQGGDGQRLGFAAREECAAVHPWQDASFAGERADGGIVAAVATGAAFEDADPEGFFLEVVECLADLEVGGVGVGGEDGGFDLVFEGADGLIALDFAFAVDGVFDAGTGHGVGDGEQFGAHGQWFV